MKKNLQTFPVSAGLLEPRHVQAIDPSSPWPIYLWCIEHVTRDEWNGKDFDGIVLNGRPVSIQQIAAELGMGARVCRRYLSRLVKKKYILQKKTGVGACTYIVSNSHRWEWKRQKAASANRGSATPEPQDTLWTQTQTQDSTDQNPASGSGPTYQKTASGSEQPTDQNPASGLGSTGRIFVGPDKKAASGRKRTRARGHRPQRSKAHTSPDGAGKKPTSNLSRSEVRGPGKSLSKSSHRSGDSSTDRGKENSAGASAAKLSSPGELILIPPASSPPKATRHAPVERFIKSTYQEANDGVDCAWNGRAGKALKDFLAEHSSSSWPIEKITQCVANRFKSDGVSLSADPHSWISDLASFLQGPKDRFGKTKVELAAAAPKTKAPRPVETIPPPVAQPDKMKALARWKEPISPTVSDDESLGFLEEPLAIGRTQ